MMREDIVAELRQAVCAYRLSGDANALHAAVTSLERLHAAGGAIADPRGAAAIVTELAAIIAQCRRIHSVRSFRRQAATAAAA